MPSAEDRNRRRAAAHVDAGRAHLQLVVDQRRKPAGIGRRDHALDRQMRAVDAQFEIAQRRRVAGQHMHVDAKRVADHAARIADAALAVERERHRQRMHDLPVGLERLLGAGRQHPLDVGRVGFVAAEIDRRRKHFAAQPAGRQIDDQRIDGQPGHALGRIDRQPDGVLGAVEIDDDAGLHALRLLVADADHLDLVGARAQDLAFLARLQPRDHAANLARADVEHRDDAGCGGTNCPFERQSSSYVFPRLLLGGLGLLGQRGCRGAPPLPGSVR